MYFVVMAMNNDAELFRMGWPKPQLEVNLILMIQEERQESLSTGIWKLPCYVVGPGQRISAFGHHFPPWGRGSCLL